jgi:regulator of cell morphogenesis and NO signaling
MKANNLRTMKTGDIVTHDFRTAAIFKNAGIDFCCGGETTLEKACTDKNLNLEKIELELLEVGKTEADPSLNFSGWDLDKLCDHIVNTHHKTVMELLPQISYYTKKIADVHGSNHPELVEIAALFTKVEAELRPHLAKEEEVLFPAIKEVLHSNSQDSKFITLREIAIMKTEHEYAGSVLDLIYTKSMNYALPLDACSTYELTFKLLEQFEDDLHIHVHLENNILYPKALELAKSGI